MRSPGFNPALGSGANFRIAAVAYFANGASAPTSMVDHAEIVSSITGASGKTTVTFREGCGTILGVFASVGMTGDAVDLCAQIGAISKGSASAGASVVVKLKTGATNTDLAAAAGAWVSLLVLIDESQTSTGETLS